MQSVYQFLRVAQYPAESLGEFHFKMLSLPVRDVANYISSTSAISLPINDQIQIRFPNQTNFMYFLELYTSHMK